ncbi:phage tail assembly chaperone [Notoacmeibacter sp. MSK16QG-6]|nr:phage tail assembly chaperone [Notoacmeibacter sp. MSK16QG-6]
MRVGLGVLHLPPSEFWAMTPRELAAAMGRTGPGDAEPTRQWLLALEKELLGACSEMEKR